MMVQESSNGEIIKNISTYPNLTFAQTIYVHGLINPVIPLFLLPNFAIKTCRIDFVYSVYFGFSIYCACAYFNNKLMYLHAPSETEKGSAPLFLK